MWIEIIAGFLVTSLLFYSLFAGADFGAGILEFFSELPGFPSKDTVAEREAREEILTHALGPVWEANHVWLILAIVILFNGFPHAFAALAVMTRFMILHNGSIQGFFKFPV
jgi:cytochrome d ubiquinol oxidase subunit II